MGLERGERSRSPRAPQLQPRLIQDCTGLQVHARSLVLTKAFRVGSSRGSGRAPLAPEWTSAARCTSPRRTSERSEVDVIRHDGDLSRLLPGKSPTGSWSHLMT